MWHPSTLAGAEIVEPVTLAEAQDQCFAPEDEFKNMLNRLIRTARGHCERYCNASWAQQTIVMQCDRFADLARLPTGPISEVRTIEYVDADGDAQVVDDAVYELHKDGLEPSILLKPGQSWPCTRPGSRIAVTAVVGGETPDEVKHAMLMLIAHWFLTRDAVVTGTIATSIPMGVDALLSNHRRGA